MRSLLLANGSKLNNEFPIDIELVVCCVINKTNRCDRREIIYFFPLSTRNRFMERERKVGRFHLFVEHLLLFFLFVVSIHQFLMDIISLQEQNSISFMENSRQTKFTRTRSNRGKSSSTSSHCSGREKGAEPSRCLTSAHSRALPMIFVLLFQLLLVVVSLGLMSSRILLFHRTHAPSQSVSFAQPAAHRLTLVVASAEERNEIFLHTSR